MKKRLYIDYRVVEADETVSNYHKEVLLPETTPTHLFQAAQFSEDLRWLEKQALMNYILELEAEIDSLNAPGKLMKALRETA